MGGRGRRGQSLSTALPKLVSLCDLTGLAGRMGVAVGRLDRAVQIADVVRSVCRYVAHAHTRTQLLHLQRRDGCLAVFS